jgi:CMP-2-keto-3-deoxyoctulosonic acid synthetase
MGLLETIEDVTLLRFIEHRIPVRLVMTDAYQLGVDTPKDLERVRTLIGDDFLIKFTI